MALRVLATISIALAVDALNLDQCVSGFVRVPETSNRVDDVLSCSSIPYDKNVSWAIQPLPDTTIAIGFCDTYGLCTQYTNVFKLRRPSVNISHLTLETFSRNVSGVTISCNVDSDTTISAKCVVETVYPAEGVTCDVQFNSSNWTVSGLCNVTKIKSSNDSYNCTWHQSDGSSSQTVLSRYVTIRTSQSTTQPNYNTAKCLLSGHPMPITSANYTYSVVISPGSGPVNATFSGSNEVRAPSTPEYICPTDYLPEFSTLKCMCRCDDVGSPAGRVIWEGTSSEQLVLYNVSRNLNNSQYKCHLQWNPTAAPQTKVFTLTVAYGPDSDTTSILGPEVFDTDGSRDMNLNCSTSDVNPTASFAWEGACSGKGQTCSVRPQPPTDVTATCRVTNAKNNNKSDTATKNVTLNYPPTDPPKISPPVANIVHYMQEKLTLNCDVNGGKPLVSRVTITCDNHLHATNSGQSAQLVIISLRADDHQTRCTCKAEWKVGALYSKTDSVNLTVYSPPSTPLIRSVNSATFFYMEADKPILTCNSTNHGVPAAHFRWSGHVTGDVATDGSGEIRLELRALTREDNGSVVTCNATNDYTDKRGTVISNITIQVYYKPDIHFTPVQDNKCTFGVDPVTCTVREGQAVHVLCVAHANPMVESLTWEGVTVGSTQLDIPITDRHKHTRLFNCSAVTAASPSDPRLPLRGTRALTIFVMFLSNVTNFSANGHHDNLTVSEREAIHLTCQANGRPTPRMQIVKADIQPSLNQTAGGELTLTDRMSSLEYGIEEARCEDTGFYSCVASNGQDGQSNNSVVLYVRCKPRSPPESVGSSPIINFIDQPVTLNFTVIAVPAPHLVKITSNSNNGTVTESGVTTDFMQGNCRPTGVMYKSVCVITVKEMERDREGFYVALLKNSVGNFEYTFEVKFNAVGGGTTISIPGIVGGILGAVVIIAAAAVVILFIKQRRASSKAKPPSGNLSKTETPDMIVNSIYGTGNRDDDAADATMITNTVYQSSGTVGTDHGTQRRDYEVVDLTATNPDRPRRAEENPYTDSEADAILYSSVDKSRKIGSATKPADTGRKLYNSKEIVTSRLQSHSNLTSGATSAASSQEPSPKAAKADTTRKPGKAEKHRKQKAKQNTEKKPIYGNHGFLSMRPIEATEYENIAFQKEGDPENKSKKSACPEVADTSNADTLTYTTIQFTDSQMQKASQPAPTRETTEYVPIDFTKRAPSDEH